MTKEVKINSIEGLKRWLSDKPSAWSHIIIIRISLRSLIMIYDKTKRSRKSDQISKEDVFFISAFRACFLSWAAYKFPSRNIIAAAVAARSAATRAASTSISTRDVAVARTAAAAARAAAFTVGNNADVIYAARTARTTHDDFWKYIVSDALWLETQGGDKAPNQATRLAAQPLWHENAPQSFQTNWQSFKRSSFATDYGYQPWIQWYEAVAPFDAKTAPHDFFSEDLIQRIATQSQKWWKRPALDINTDIARWLAEETTAPPIKDATAKLAEAIDQLPDAPESPEVFDWRDGCLEVLPPQALSEDDGVAQDYLEEAREKAEHMLDRLRRTNADPAITRAVKKLLDVLTDRPSDLRPARVDSCADTLRFLVETHNNDTDERELSSVVLAGLMDLSLTTRKLCSCLPMMWKREAAHLTDSLPPDPTDTFQNLETVRHTAEDSGILGDSARATLTTQSSDVKDQTAEPLRRREIAKYLLIARDLMLKMLRGAGAKATDMAKALANLAKEAAQAARLELVKEMSKDMVKGYRLARTAAVGGVAYVFTNASEAISHITQLPGFEELAQVAKWIARLISSSIGL